MSQYDFSNIDPDLTSGTALATLLNSWREAVKTHHAGASRPSYAVAGMLWVKTVSATAHELYYYDGADDILIAAINPTANTLALVLNGPSAIGTTRYSHIGLIVANAALSGANQVGVLSAPVGTSGATTSVQGFNGRGDTAAGSFTCAQSIGFYADNPTKGAGSTITSLYGVSVADLTQGANNYGIASAVSAGANKRNLHITGTADNYLAGNVGIGVAPTYQVDVRSALTGTTAGSNRVGNFCSAASGRDCHIGLGDNVNTAAWIGYLAGDLYLGTDATKRLQVALSGGHVTPGADNTQTLGSASYRWSTVYAGTGTINTSDARTKQDIRDLAAPEIAAARQLAAEVGTYRFIAAVEAKGAAARQHVGLTVQRAIQIMEAHDLDPLAYGFICFDAWAERAIEHPAQSHEEETGLFDAQGRPALRTVIDAEAWTETIPAGDTYGFRSDELLLFIARGLAAGQADLEARVAALESAA